LYAPEFESLGIEKLLLRRNHLVEVFVLDIDVVGAYFY
jgi:hypothetical protein